MGDASHEDDGTGGDPIHDYQPPDVNPNQRDPYMRHRTC